MAELQIEPRIKWREWRELENVCEFHQLMASTDTKAEANVGEACQQIHGKRHILRIQLAMKRASR